MAQSDQDLDRLSELLFALPHEHFPMTLGELDGYLTGVLACPDLIPPSEWLPHVWGETGDANFPDMKTAEDTIGAVMAHYNSLAEGLTRSVWIEPLYEVDPNSDETLWEPWIDGLTRAMGLRPAAWQALIKRADDDTQASIIFLMALQDICEGTSKFTEEEIDEIDLEAPELIPNCMAQVLILSRPELAMGVSANSPHPVRTKRPGRNDPCPCGSGRKYKQCCGKN
ncbi:UPF0149 family protein [Pseudogemmobacter sp. W21_MBD1_M6]|uniref:UPF0149 family protein n=1 Tax=Pseudogemmobacter sp. W21_MBD1_M6 TaxID=3240271 RepID=UPI003F9B4BA2